MFKEANIPQEELNREIKKEISYPESMNYELVEKWGDGIPSFAESDPKSPEWKSTPIIPIDLSREGFGEIFIKNESDRASNPTGTIKDRAAWELATLYRDYARSLYLKIKTGSVKRGELEKFKIPRLSLISSGNEGRAIAECFLKYDLPPPKILVGKNTKEEIVGELLKLRADVYVTDLSKNLKPEDIKAITNNPNGIDLTSTRALDPSSVFYDWHVHEVLNEKPDEIYVPYGSGRLMENYLFWQAKSIRNDMQGKKDPRLKIPISKIVDINIFGGEPEKYPSKADKLDAPYKPFLLFQDEDIKSFVNLAFTGKNTGKEKFSEEYIKEAHKILTSHKIEAEISAAAGLAIYMNRFEKGLIGKEKKIIIVNTGKGLV